MSTAPRINAETAPSGPPDLAPETRHASATQPEPVSGRPDPPSIFAFLDITPDPPAELPDAPPELPDGPAELLATAPLVAPTSLDTETAPTEVETTTLAEVGIEPLSGTLFTPVITVASPSLADYLRTLPSTTDDTWRPSDPPSLDGIDDIALNVETDGTDWRKGDRPVGVTVMTLEGQLKRFLPFRFAGGNLDEAVVKRWAERELRGKHILNANTRFDVHMMREWGVDLEDQGCTVSDVMHYAALVDDHRKRFKLDVLVKDYLHEDGPPRVDESRMTSYHASEVAERAEYQVEAVARLRDELWPEMDAQHLQGVRQLEDDVIYPLCEMERNGVPVDEPLLQQFGRECQQTADRLLLEISREMGFGFTPSPAGWKELFERLSLPPSEEGYAEEIITAVDHPTVQKGFRASQYASLHSKTFAAYPKQIQNGVLYYDINQLRGDEGGTVCLPAGELILTNRGYLETELVQLGDLVISHKGKPRRVIRTIDNGVQPIVKVTLSNGLTLRTTPNHQYQTDSEWVEASSLKHGDSICVHSDPEQWKVIEGWSDFEVSSWGRVFNQKTKRMATQWPKYLDTNQGHLKVTLRRNGEQQRGEDLKDFAVHRLVAEAFLGRNDGAETRHLNGIAWDNTVGNLAWGSAQDNREDAIKHGTLSKRKDAQAKLTAEAVAFIRSEPQATRVKGITNKQLATMFGVCERLIRAVRSGDRWPDKSTGEKTVQFRYATVVSVEWQPPENTYGLSVEEDHSHVTGGIVTHNSGRFSIGYIQQVPKHDGHHAVFGEGDVDLCHGACPLFPRRLFIAGSGEYLDADAMQIEQRLFANDANNPRVNAEYARDPLRSFHKITWEMLKQVKPDQLYSDTKNFNFAFQYGAKMVKLSVMMKFITAKEGEEIRKAKAWNDPRLNRIKEIEAAYKQMIPEGNFLLDMMSHLAKPACDQYCKKDDVFHRKYQHRGFVATALGRRSRFPDSYKTYIGLNRKLQGDAADIMKRKIVELHRERKQTGFTMRMTVHDSVGGDATTSETKDRVMTILNRQSVVLRIPILWDVKTGKNWAESQ